MSRDKQKLLRRYSKEVSTFAVLHAFQQFMNAVAPGMVDHATNPWDTTEAIEKVLGNLAASEDKSFRSMCRIAEKLGMEPPERYPTTTGTPLQ
jgi:hypothetical protein